MTTMLHRLAAADFENLPEGRIRCDRGDEAHWLRVVEIRTLPPGLPRAAPPFAVVLREDGARQSLPQGIYRYGHPVHGALDLFTVPLGPDGAGMRYEIIFN